MRLDNCHVESKDCHGEGAFWREWRGGEKVYILKWQKQGSREKEQTVVMEKRLLRRVRI